MNLFIFNYWYKCYVPTFTQKNKKNLEKRKAQAHTHYWEIYSKMCNHKVNYHSLAGEKGIQWTTKKNTSIIAHCKLHCIMFSWGSFFAPLLECMHLLTSSKNLCHWVPIFVSHSFFAFQTFCWMSKLVRVPYK